MLALAARGFGPQEIVDALIALLNGGLPAAALVEDPFRPAAVRAFRNRLEAVCREVHGLIAPRLSKARIRNAREIERGLAGLLDRLDQAPGDSPGDLPADLAELRDRSVGAAGFLGENLLKHLHDWSRGRLGDTEAALFGDVRAELAGSAALLEQLLQHLGRLDPVLLEHGRRALHPLLLRAERELRSRGIATFDFLLTGAEALLAGHAEVRRQVRRRIDQLLVDEFQDTDRTQCEILRWIALDGPAEERPGLFLVGDPKQSIYGWRSADLRAYDGFVSLARQAGGEVMSLVENFRSVPAILDEVARVVEPVMRGASGRAAAVRAPASVRAAAARGGLPPRWDLRAGRRSSTGSPGRMMPSGEDRGLPPSTPRSWRRRSWPRTSAPCTRTTAWPGGRSPSCCAAWAISTSIWTSCAGRGCPSPWDATSSTTAAARSSTPRPWCAAFSTPGTTWPC